MKIKERSEIPIECTWKLEDIFPDDGAWEKEYAVAQRQIEGVGSFQGTLGDGPEALKMALDVESLISQSVERLFVYASMRRDQDNGAALYQGMTDRALALSTQLASASSYMVPEILEIDSAALRSWAERDDLRSYRHQLEDLIRGKAHVLSRAEERLLAMGGEVMAGPQGVFRMLDYADMKFPSVSTPEGEAELSQGSYVRLMESPDRAVRKDAFTKLYGAYHAYRNTYGATLSASIKGDVFNARARKYPSALEAALFDDNVPISVYDSLIEAVQGGLPDLHRYMKLRKRLLRLDELHMYDLYAPLSDADFSIDYPQAQALLLEGLGELGSDYCDVLREAFDSRWIDVYQNKGKSSGAYSWGCYGVHPYVLMNYQPGIDSLFTLAHEMGHAMHSYYSDDAQDYNNAQYKILVAEVASTVNETLLMHHLLDAEKNRGRKLRLLNYYLEQFRTTVYRQVMFAEFEKAAHQRCEEGEALTAETFSEIYLELNRKYHGEDMVVDGEIAMEWARVSHFYNAFYVYKYATGFSAAVAISAAIRSRDRQAIVRYRRFLQQGGSDYPLTLLKGAGVDLTKPDVVRNALWDFSDSLDRLEELL